MSGVHQFVPMLHNGDAVGGHTLGVQRHLRAAGVCSEIYVEQVDPETQSATRPAAAYPEDAESGDVIVYQFATASDLAPWLAARPERLVVNYHNVTPAELLAPWDNPLARHQLRARAELAALAGRTSLGVAVSEHNRADLVALGFSATAVVPPVLDKLVDDLLGNPASASNGRSTGDRGGRRARWLTVGRLAPNKAVEDVINALLVYRSVYDPDASLLVVGKPALAAYAQALRRYSADLGLARAVCFAGWMTDDALADAYRQSDVVVVASEHEGFCVPLVEAMGHGVPVVAYRSGAVAEVLGDAGLLVEAKDPVTVAGAVHSLVSDAAHHDDVVAAGRRRLGALGLADAGPRLVELVLAVRDNLPLPSDR